MVRLILAGGVFDDGAEDEAWHEPSVAGLTATAARRLESACGDDFDLLAASAQEDQRRTLGRFLARLLLLGLGEEPLQRTIDLWVEVQREMLARLRADWAAISAWAGEGPLACKVSRVEGELSDRHDGGRSAAILTFESGWKVVYKPRAMQADAWYSRLLDWLNALEAPVSFRSPRVLARDGYGWMEFVAHERCGSRAELSEHYRNAGGLLCILYLLRATDCHFQNLIACGVRPVLVDAEMLLQPALQASDAWTVTRTGLIPNFRFGPGGETYDVSGLGFVRPQATHFEVPEWSEGGVQFRPGWLAPTKSVPFGDDAEARPHLFAAEMEDGFVQMHCFAEQRRDELIAQVESARKLRVRFLLRETMEYYAAWKHKDGSSIYLAELPPSYAIFSGLLAEELAALRRFDVPRFTLAAESRDLQEVRGCFAASGYELALSGIRELGEKDRDLQMGQMRVAWGFARLASALA